MPGKFRRAASVGKSLKLLRARAKAPRAQARRALIPRVSNLQGSRIVEHYR
jgi:hypothetical protein